MDTIKTAISVYKGPAGIFIPCGGTAIKTAQAAWKLMQNMVIPYGVPADKLFPLIALDSEFEPAENANQDQEYVHQEIRRDLGRNYHRLFIPKPIIWADHPQLKKSLSRDQFTYIEEIRRDVAGFDRNRWIGCLSVLLNIDEMKELILAAVSHIHDPDVISKCSIQYPPIFWIIGGKGGGTGSGAVLVVCLLLAVLKLQKLIPSNSDINLIVIDPLFTNSTAASQYNAAILDQELLGMSRPGYQYKFPDAPQLPEVKGKPFTSVIPIGKGNGKINLQDIQEAAQEFSWIVRLNHDLNTFHEYSAQSSNIYSRSDESDLAGNKRIFRGEGVQIIKSQEGYKAKAAAAQALLEGAICPLLGSDHFDDQTISENAKNILIRSRVSPMTLQANFEAALNDSVDNEYHQISSQRPNKNPDEEAIFLMEAVNEIDQIIENHKSQIVEEGVKSSERAFRNILINITQNQCLKPGEVYVIFQHISKRMAAFPEELSIFVEDKRIKAQESHNDALIAIDRLKNIPRLPILNRINLEVYKKERQGALTCIHAHLLDFSTFQSWRGVSEIFSQATPNGHTLVELFNQICVTEWRRKYIANLEYLQVEMEKTLQTELSNLLQPKPGFIKIIDQPSNSTSLQHEINDAVKKLSSNSRWMDKMETYKNELCSKIENLSPTEIKSALLKETESLVSEITGLSSNIEEQILNNPVARKDFLDGIRNAQPFIGQLDMDLLKTLGFLENSKFVLVLTPNGRKSKLVQLAQTELKKSEFKEEMFVDGGNTEELAIAVSQNGIPAYGIIDIIRYQIAAKNYRNLGTSQYTGLVLNPPQIERPQGGLLQEVRKLYLKALAWGIIIIEPIKTIQGIDTEQFVCNFPKHIENDKGKLILEEVEKIIWDSLEDLDQDVTTPKKEDYRFYWEQQSSLKLKQWGKDMGGHDQGAKKALTKLGLLSQSLVALMERDKSQETFIQSLLDAIKEIIIQEFQDSPVKYEVKKKGILWPKELLSDPMPLAQAA